MEFFDALSNCWWLGKQCVPEWDAWAAGAAFVAVVATVILGVVTFRLGKAANKATALATDIALHQVKAEEFRSETEELLVLVQVTGEVSINQQRVSDLLVHLDGGGLGDVHFIRSEKFRSEIFAQIESLRFPLTEAVTGRLHYLDRKIAARLIRAAALVSIVQDGCRNASPHDTEDDLRHAHGGLVKVLPMVIADLKIVRIACEESVTRLGIENRDLARVGVALAATDEEA